MLLNLSVLLQRNTTRRMASAVAAVKTQQRQKPHQKSSHQKSKQKPTTPPLISCKRTEFNMWLPEKESTKFGSIPLASNGWMHHKSKSDHFTFNATQELPTQMTDLTQFLSDAKLQLDERLLKNLKQELEITQVTDIQALGLPKIYDCQHVLVAAETGCGKTLTYMLPLLQHILKHKKSISERKMNTPIALIITPGRELATQIGHVAEALCKDTGIQVKTVLGGNTKQLMLNPDFDEVDVLVASMGAISKLITTGIYRMEQVRHVVLDEADTLLDDSFGEKLCHLLRRFPFHKNHLQDEHTIGTQLTLASATMPTNIKELLQRIIDVETLQQVISPNLHKLMPHVQQKFQRMPKSDRPAHLLSLVKTELSRKRPLIVFSNKSAASDYVSIFLNNCGVNCLNLNGDMLMKIRLGRFEQFQDGQCDVLSTTDVGSRGLDTTRARHVVNFDFPLHVSDYIHRCGRIGRVGSGQKCFVTNFISSRREIEGVQHIEHAARTGGLLPNVNANIKNLINQRIMKEMQEAGVPPGAPGTQEEVF